VAAYRIVHEAVTNVIRHANAARCVVSINYLGRDENAALHITIEDDGEGFKKKNHHGVGLNSMRERAEELGGTFTIEETPNGGTRVSARIPIYKAEE
jgi:signal transduction histidine kinase